MSLPPKRCGRPPVLSFLEKKKRKQSLDRRRGKTRIYVGNHIDRWLALKEKLDFRNDAEVAGFLLDLYDSCDPLSKAPICSLSQGMRRITVKEEKALPGRASLIAADGMYDNDDQLSEESACSGLGDVRIVTVKEEGEMLLDCSSTEKDDMGPLRTWDMTLALHGVFKPLTNMVKVSSKKKIKLLYKTTGAVLVHFDFAVRVL